MKVHDARLLYVAIAVVAVIVLAYVYVSSNTSNNITVRLEQVNPSNSTYPYQTTLMRILVSNNGSSYVRNLPLDLYINGRLLNSYTVSIPPLKQAVVDANYTYRESGNYSFDAVADPAHVIHIVNRSASQSSITINVLVPEHPNVYTAIPNNGINYTEAFSIFTPGVSQLEVLDKVYNMSMAENFYGAHGAEISAVYSDLLSYIREINGAYVTYSNGTSAYVSWMQGDINPAMVDIVLGTFRVGVTNHTIGNQAASFARINSNTSMCVAYDGGWTKIVTYLNNSLSDGTCLSFIGRNFSPSESNTLTNMLKSNTTLFNDKSRFVYTNSSQTGFMIEQSGSGLAIANMFQNSFGLFATYLKELKTPINISLINSTCRGLIYNQSRNVDVCSIYEIPSSTSNFSMINTTEITPDYVVGVYSLVNKTNAVLAHLNGASLIASLGINQTPLSWTSPFKNSCAFNNSSLGCKIEGINSSTSAVNLSITNGYNYTIHITSAICSLSQVASNQTVNSTIAPASSANIVVACYTPPIPLASALLSYALSVRYTATGNRTATATGYLNMTN